MPCLVMLGLLMPRLLMFFIFLLTDWFGRAFETAIFPIIGFFIMPHTTLAYMAAMLNNNFQLSGWWIALFAIAIIVDLGSGASASSS